MNAFRRWRKGWLYRRTTTWRLNRGGKWAVGYETRDYPFIRIAIPLRTVHPIVRRVVD